MTTESMWEDAQERFEEEPFESLLYDKNGLRDFVEWLSTEMPEAARKLMDNWLVTKDGKAFEGRSVESILDDLTSRSLEPEDRTDR